MALPKPGPGDIPHRVTEFHGEADLLLAGEAHEYFMLPFLCFGRSICDHSYPKMRVIKKFARKRGVAPQRARISDEEITTVRPGIKSIVDGMLPLLRHEPFTPKFLSCFPTSVLNWRLLERYISDNIIASINHRPRLPVGPSLRFGSPARRMRLRLCG